MGVDARMLIKIKGEDNWLSHEDTVYLSYCAGASFGHNQFVIYNDPEHPDWQCRAIEIIEPHDDESYRGDLVGKVVYFQDAPYIIADPDEQFIRIRPSTSYYGIGYERGDLPFLVVLAQWLERKIPHGELWYGGDSGGFGAYQFTKEYKKELMDHFVEHGHAPYVGLSLIHI